MARQTSMELHCGWLHQGILIFPLPSFLHTCSSADYVLTTFSNDDAVFALTTHPTLSQYVLAETFVNYRSSVVCSTPHAVRL